METTFLNVKKEIEWLAKIQETENSIVYLIKNGRGCGMTTFLVKYCLYKFLENENYKIAYITPNYMMADDVFRKFSSYLNYSLLDKDNSIIKKIKYEISFINGNTILFTNTDITKFRGRRFNLIIIDDSYLIDYKTYVKLKEYICSTIMPKDKIIEIC